MYPKYRWVVCGLRAWQIRIFHTDHTAPMKELTFSTMRCLWGWQSEAQFAEALGMTPQLRDKMFCKLKSAFAKALSTFPKKYFGSGRWQLEAIANGLCGVVLLHRPMPSWNQKKWRKPLHPARQRQGQELRSQQSKPMQIELLKKSVSSPHLQPASTEHHQHWHDRRGHQRQHGIDPRLTAMAVFGLLPLA